jgi:hypothetical protein
MYTHVSKCKNNKIKLKKKQNKMLVITRSILTIINRSNTVIYICIYSTDKISNIFKITQLISVEPGHMSKCETN